MTATRTKWTKTPLGSLIATTPDGREICFSRPGGGYVYCDMGRDDRSGTLGQQICYGGGTMGNTIHERDDTAFEREVKKWYAQSGMREPAGDEGYA